MSAGGIEGQVVDAELAALVEQQSVEASLDAELDETEQSVGGALLLDVSCASTGADRPVRTVAMIIRVFMLLLRGAHATAEESSLAVWVPNRSGH
jgi:hypothetical protein